MSDTDAQLHTRQGSVEQWRADVYWKRGGTTMIGGECSSRQDAEKQARVYIAQVLKRKGYDDPTEVRLYSREVTPWERADAA